WLDLQAAHRDRGPRGAPDQAVRVLSVYRYVHRSGGQIKAGLAQLGSLRQPGDGSADGARAVVRHLLLPPRQQVLLVAEGPRPADSALGSRLRVRADERLRPHPAGARARAHDRVEAPQVLAAPRSDELEGRPALEPGRLAQPRHRPGLSERDTAPDGPLLCRDRERW